MKYKFFILILSFTFISAKCRKDDDIKIDPCKDQSAFKADFVVEEKVGDTSYPTTTALAPGYVFFKAKGNYDSVRWYIGSSQNTSTKVNHALYFMQAEGNIEVMFIGYKKPNTQCFPNDKAADTVKKRISILNRDNTIPIVGRYLGYNTSSPADTFSVYINADNSVGIWQYFVKNIPKNCPGAINGSDAPPRNIGLNVAGGYSAFSINNGSIACELVTGFGYLKNTDSLIINYTATPMSSGPPFTYGQRGQFKFIGVRKP